ncbi:MAG: hypothetical protein WB770_10530 [Acidimicrobiales bacterium]
MDLEIEHVDESRAVDWYDVGAAAHGVDEPDLLEDPVEEIRAQMPDGSPSWRMEFHIGYVDRTPVVRGRLALPTRDNHQLADLRIQVVPEFRRRGHGRAMFQHLRARSVARGRSILIGEVCAPLEGDSPGREFAESLGVEHGLTSIRRILDLRHLDLAVLEGLEVEARKRATGYELAQWGDHAPEDLVDDFATLVARMVTDSPMGELKVGEEMWDRNRIREMEDATFRWGRSRFAAGARAVGTGQLVAITELGVSRFQPEIAYQWDTIVAPEHRGHRLGFLVKAANLRQLMAAMPSTSRVATWNAESNTFMVEVNERLGFRAVDRREEWQLTVEDTSSATG